MRLSSALSLSIIAAAALAPTSAWAAAGVNGAACLPTLADAIAAAGSGDTIYVSPGTYTIVGQTITSNVTIVSSDNSCSAPTVKQVTFVGDNTDRLFLVDSASVVFRDLTIKNNTFADFGALMWVVRGSALLDNVTMRNGSGSSGGCVALHLGAGLTMMNGSRIWECEASTHGGGVYVDDGAILALSGSEIDHNVADDDGGGIWARNASIYLGDTDVVDNEAGRDGGGIYVDWSVASSFLTVADGAVSRNTAVGDGGGIAHTSIAGILSLTDGARIASNSATNGGGVLVSTGDASLTKEVTVIGNDATDDGGGLMVGPGTEITMAGDDLGDILISGNTAGGFGAGISTDTPTIDASFVTLIDNVAGDNGGGIYARNPWSSTDIMTLDNTRFIRNEATNGGGLLANGVEVAIATDFDSCDPSTLAKDRFCSEFRKNGADSTTGSGGGIAAINGASVEVNTTSFVQNTGSDALAAGVSGSGSELLMRNALVVGHTSGLVAVRAELGGDLDVRSSTLTDNGPAVDYDAGTTGAFHRNIVWDNSAPINATGIPGNCNQLGTLVGAPTGAANVTGDPLFDALNTRSAYKLTLGSPAIDACGTGPSVDLDGVSRAQGVSFDRGAFEMP